MTRVSKEFFFLLSFFLKTSKESIIVFFIHASGSMNHIRSAIVQHHRFLFILLTCLQSLTELVCLTLGWLGVRFIAASAIETVGRVPAFLLLVVEI